MKCELFFFFPIITVIHILIITIWIIMYTYHEQKRSPHTLELPQLGHFAPLACLFRCTCFCRIHDKLFEYASAMDPRHSKLFGKLRHLTVCWWFFFFFFNLPRPDLYSLWSLNKQKTIGFDGRISVRVAGLHHLVHALAATRTVCHWLSFPQWTAGQAEPCVTSFHLFILGKMPKSCPHRYAKESQIKNRRPQISSMLQIYMPSDMFLYH